MAFTPDIVNVNLYEALGLPLPGQVPTALDSEKIKAAFRAAVLRHHPDKATANLVGLEKLDLKNQIVNSSQLKKAPTSAVSIDVLLRARQVLLNATLRREYDLRLSLNRGSVGTDHGVLCNTTSNGFGAPEFEVFDLDDMQYDSDAFTWTRACRCGNPSAYTLTEDDLMQASESQGVDGEVFVGCEDCSLFAKVMFHVLEDA